MHKKIDFKLLHVNETGTISGFLPVLIMIAVLCLNTLSAYADVSPNGKSYTATENGLYFELKTYRGQTYYRLVDADPMEELIVPEEINDIPVTEIVDDSFRTRIDIERLVLSSKVSVIGMRAFMDCQYLEHIEFHPEGRLEVNSGAFFGIGVENVECKGIISSLKFELCENLKSVYINKESKGIELDRCNKLSEIKMEEGIEETPVVSECPSLSSVTIPVSVENIGGFIDCASLSVIDIPYGANILTIGKISNCPIESLYIPDSAVINEISGVKLTEIKIPTNQNKWCYSNIPSVIKVHYPSLEKFYEVVIDLNSLKPYKYSGPQFQAEVYIAGAPLTEITFPAPDNNFRISGVTTLVSAIIPDSSFPYNLQEAFAGCSNLKSLSIGKGAISNSYSMCLGCENLETFVIDPKNRTNELSSYVFQDCKKLKEVSFPYVKKIDWSCFKGCESLVSVNLPMLENIDGGDRAGAFQDCTSLTTIDFPELKTIGACTFKNCTSLAEINLPLCEEFSWFGVFSGCSSLRKISLPLLQEVTESAFENCISLEEIELPKVYKVGNNAFSGCSSLISFPFPQLKEIGYEAFSDCKSLTEASLLGLSKNTERIFQNCTGLKHLILSGIFPASYYGAPNLELLEVLDDVESVYLFGGFNGEPATVIFYGNVGTLKDSAFRNCSNLQKIIFKGTIQNIGNNIFYGAENLKSVDITDPKQWITAEGSSAFNDYTQPHWDLYVRGEKISHLVIEDLDAPVRIGSLAYCNISGLTLKCREGYKSSIGDNAFF